MTDDRSKLLISENPYHSLDQRPNSSQRPIKITKVNEEEEEEEEDRDSLGSDSTMKSRNPRIQRYLVAVEYIGTRFYGAQQQATCRTVVGVLEEAFRKFIGQSVSIICSSRTHEINYFYLRSSVGHFVFWDAGVHALSNVCHVDVERISKRKPGEVLPPHEPAVVKKAVNHFLQKNEGDIRVIDVRCVSSEFHARYKAQERTYFYRLLSDPESVSTFEKDRAWHVPEDLDLPTMQKACKILVGHHDFSSFRAAGCQAKSPIRSLDELSVTEVVSAPYFPPVMAREPQNADDPSECSDLNIGMPCISSASKQNTVQVSNGEASKVFGMRGRHRCFVVTARSRSFLYHQVRLIVGTLKAVGTGDLTVPDVEHILKAKTVSAASPMAPACGLYLAHVKYDLS